MMAAAEEMKTTDATNPSKPASKKIDLDAPAGSKNSLGEESVRDVRPSTDDETVEAIDEATPGVPASPIP